MAVLVAAEAGFLYGNGYPGFFGYRGFGPYYGNFRGPYYGNYGGYYGGLGYGGYFPGYGFGGYFLGKWGADNPVSFNVGFKTLCIVYLPETLFILLCAWYIGKVYNRRIKDSEVVLISVENLSCFVPNA